MKRPRLFVSVDDAGAEMAWESFDPPKWDDDWQAWGVLGEKCRFRITRPGEAPFAYWPTGAKLKPGECAELNRPTIKRMISR